MQKNKSKAHWRRLEKQKTVYFSGSIMCHEIERKKERKKERRKKERKKEFN